MSKRFVLGAHRAEWITKRGKRVLRISGGINQQNGQRGLDMSPYIAKAFADWLCTDWPAPQASENCEVPK